MSDIQHIPLDLKTKKDEFRDEQFGVYLQPIQHFNVTTIGWIMFLQKEVEIQFWQDFFNSQLRKKGHKGDMVGLSVRKPLDGTKHMTNDTLFDKLEILLPAAVLQPRVQIPLIEAADRRNCRNIGL